VTRVHDDAPLVPQPIVSIYIIGVLSRKGGIRLWSADHSRSPQFDLTLSPARDNINTADPRGTPWLDHRLHSSSAP
jgi:hypothetical protein